MDRDTLHRFFAGHTSRDEDASVIDWAETDASAFEAERQMWNASLFVSVPRRVRRRWIGELLRTAAVLVLVVGGLWMFRSEPRSGDMSISVPVGQQLDVTLGDGTKVVVNGGSTLTWPGVFASERRVRLVGEAYFSVPKEDRPFVLETAAYDVHVLGTEFNVEAYEGQFAVSLVEGSLRVDEMTLRPGDRVWAENGRLVAGRIPPSEQFLWRDGVIAFERASMPQLVTLFEKYFGFTFEYGQLPDMVLSGKIRISDGVDHALWVLRQNAKFKYEKDVDNMRITIKKQ